ncbi:MAG TPA: pyruvate kinase alpha/beta domain-containing protein [Syntrophomonadaceae bacterium]|nr:pyruvate kinase alpha/beta domain-containing protein [Syntrophomonadaceae bacterium]
MYFKNAGKLNTDQTIELAIKRAKELKITNIVVASNQGDSAKKLLPYKNDFNIVCVTHHVGFREPGSDEMDTSTRKMLQDEGIKILTTTHLLAGVDRGVRNHFGGVYPAEIIAQTLRILGQGTKVAVEISVMALDAGLIPHDEEILAVAGTARGLDTAIIISPAHANHFFNTEIKEIICMPRNKKVE